MSNVMSEARAEMSSPIKLDPETIKIRNALIEKFSDKSIEDLNTFIDDALIVERDEFKRLGLLAARVHILRQRVLALKAFNRDDTIKELPSTYLTLPDVGSPDLSVTVDDDHLDENHTDTDWRSLKMIEPGEVNGVRFFKGTMINASVEDADRLISSGKAIVVDNEGNPVDTNDTTTDEMAETEETETEAVEAEGNETEVMETEEPETGEPKIEAAETEGNEAEVMETEGLETEEPKIEATETEEPKIEATETEAAEAEGNETEVMETEEPETEATETGGAEKSAADNLSVNKEEADK